MSYGANRYKQTHVSTASPGQVLIMLYEAAIRHVKRAQNAIGENDQKTKGEAIGKAHDILNELASTLNFEVGGDIARDLERLYNYMIDQLLVANMENSKEALANVQAPLENLLEGWRVAVQQVSKGGG